MQHLKPVGASEDGVESVLLAATSNSQSKGKGKAKDPLTLRADLPTEALPSVQELPRDYTAEGEVPEAIAGFRPDMDPHLRQTLAALEDDAFVDEALDDDFFGALLGGGELDEEGQLEFEFEEYGVDEAEDEGEDEEQEQEGGWEARFAAFKRAQKAEAKEGALPSEFDGHSEGGDTLGTLPALSVIGGKRRRKGASDASGYSMSSSSMFRNEGLTTLDERFDQVAPFQTSRIIQSHTTPADRKAVPVRRRRGR
jgi:protein LTV1